MIGDFIKFAFANFKIFTYRFNIKVFLYVVLYIIIDLAGKVFFLYGNYPGKIKITGTCFHDFSGSM